MEQLDRESFYKLVVNRLDTRFYQLWDYEAARSDNCGCEAVRTTCGAIALVRIKTVPLIGRGLAYIYEGPIFTDAKPSQRQLEKALTELRDEYTRRNLLLRIVPPLRPDRDEDLRSALSGSGFHQVNGAGLYRTILLPIADDAEIVKGGFKKRLRYAVNRSIRNGFEIDRGTDLKLYDRFLTLYDEMWARKRFDTGVDPRWLRAVQERLPESCRLVIRIARLGNDDMAGTVHAHVGNTVLYLLGATRVEENANPNRLFSSHYLHWDVILAAVETGTSWYDLGGIDPTKNPGGYAFKEAFGGEDVSSVGAWQVGDDFGSRFVVVVGEIFHKHLKSVINGIEK